MKSKKQKGCVYFFRHIGLTPVKIGYSSKSPPIKRIKTCETYAPYGVEMLGFIQLDNAKKVETELHRKYFGFRRFGEWFEITEDQVKFEIESYSKLKSK